jgi:hypothetical protein
LKHLSFRDRVNKNYTNESSYLEDLLEFPTN